jgi:hypothetical protein
MTRCFFQSPPLSVMPRVVAATFLAAALVFFVTGPGTVSPLLSSGEVGQHAQHGTNFGGPALAHPRSNLTQEGFHFVSAEQSPSGNGLVLWVPSVERADKSPTSEFLNANQNVMVAHIALDNKSGVTNALFGLFPRCNEAPLAFKYPSEPSYILFRQHGGVYTPKKSACQIISTDT